MLTPQDVQTNGQIPNNSFVVLSGKVYVDIGVLIGETVDSLTDTVMGEFALKLHMGCWNAQNIWNGNKATGQRLNVWQQPVSGSSQYYSNVTPVGYYQSWSFTGNVLVPANLDQVVAVYQ